TMVPPQTRSASWWLVPSGRAGCSRGPTPPRRRRHISGSTPSSRGATRRRPRRPAPLRPGSRKILRFRGCSGARRRGAGRVRAEWLILGNRLENFLSLLGTQRKRVLDLVGKRREDVFRDDPIATKWVRAQIGSLYGKEAGAEGVCKFLGSKPPEGLGMYQTE